MAIFGKRTISQEFPAVQPAGPAYGIEEMIALMRTFPDDEENEDLIIRVVKNTLESVRVQIPDLINAATRKQRHIEERVAALEAQIVDLDMQIMAKREEITTLNADYDETSHLKERLELDTNPPSHGKPREVDMDAGMEDDSDTPMPDHDNAQQGGLDILLENLAEPKAR
jgi:hypothetical protein